jgi:hypothetical protein
LAGLLSLNVEQVTRQEVLVSLEVEQAVAREAEEDRL